MKIEGYFIRKTYIFLFFLSFNRIDLIQQLLGKIENAGDIAAQSEVKILDLLQKQTRLQEESVNNEREFLNVFKNIMNNTNANR